MMKGFKDLDVYRLAYRLAMRIFELSRSFPKEEWYVQSNYVAHAEPLHRL